MRIGKDNKWGYSFKLDSGVSYEQMIVVSSILAGLCDHNRFFADSSVWLEGTRIELTNPGAIWGIADKSREKKEQSIGIVWSTDEKHLMEALYKSEISEAFDFWPYNIDPGRVYAVIDGEAYITDDKE